MAVCKKKINTNQQQQTVQPNWCKSAEMLKTKQLDAFHLFDFILFEDRKMKRENEK